MDVDLISGGKNSAPDPWIREPLFEEFQRENPYPSVWDDRRYNIRRDTIKGTCEAVMKYNTPLVATYDKDLFASAMADTIEDYGLLEGQGRVIPASDVLIVPESSCGPVYKRMGCENKAEAYARCPDLMDWFWKYAHEEDYPVLWKEFGKCELLKVEKTTRGISVGPADFQLAGARMNQNTNILIGGLGNKFDQHPSRVGMIMQSGGLHHYASYIGKGNPTFTTLSDGHDHNSDSLDPPWLIISSDLFLWDANLLRELFGVVKNVRYFLWDKKGMSEEEWWKRTNYYYNEKVWSFILLPNGQVVLKRHGNPSGQDSTTYDNTIIHHFIKNYMWRKLTGLGLSPHARAERLRHYRFGLYGDDNNEAVSPKYAQCYSVERRRAAYAEFGIVLSESKDYASIDIIGHTWLGKMIAMEGNRYVGTVGVDKVLCSLLNVESKTVDPGLVLQRALALMVESTFTAVLGEYVRQFVYWLIDRHIRVPPAEGDSALTQWVLAVPSRYACKQFLLGLD